MAIDSHGLFVPDRPLEVYAKNPPIPSFVPRIPPYKYQEYPKQILKRATQADVDASHARSQNFDEKRQIMRYTARPPKIGELIAYRDPESDQFVTVADEDEEDRFYAAHPDVIRIDVPRTRTLENVDDGEWEAFQRWKSQQQNALQSAAKFQSPEEEKAALLIEAEKLGMTTEKKWGLDRIRNEVMSRRAMEAA